MADYLGARAVGSTVYFAFTTHQGSGAPVAPLSAFEAGDLRIYKNGSATERSSSAGITMTSPFDSVTGLHHVAIDLSDNTDAGFYAAGSQYQVVLIPDSETVDGQTVTKVLARFDISNSIDDILAAVDTEVAAILAKVTNLPEGIAKNTALSNFEFYMVQSTDHVSPATGLTITAERSIDGGGFAAMANSASEVSAGVYKINLAAADTNGDFITYKFTATGADATVVSFKTEV